MASTMFNTSNSRAGGRPPRRQRSSLIRLCLVRGLLAMIWAVLFSRAHEVLDARTITLLIAYPLIDAVSSLIDYRTSATRAYRQVIAFNGVLSTAAALALGAAALRGVAPALAVFGAWAVLSGAAQLLLGLERRGAELGRQWPMLIAGALSFLVGFLYIVQSTGATPMLDILQVYATGGGIFFILQACLLGWRARRRQRYSLL